MFLFGDNSALSDISFRIYEGEEFEVTFWPYVIVFPLLCIATIEAAIKKGLYSLLYNTKPETNCWFVDRNGTLSEFVKNYSATWKVLDFLYNHESERDYGSVADWTYNFWSTLDEFWVNNRNAQAVRNRFIISKRLLREEIKRAARDQDVVKVFSLASGSAEALIEVIAEMNEQLTDTTVQAHLVDIKRAALQKAKELASKHGVRRKVTTEQTTAGNVLKAISSPKQFERRHSAFRREKLKSPKSVRWSISDLGDYKPHVCEMIGFLDYLPDKKARTYMQQIRTILTEDGAFLTCNIFRNLEMYFLMFVVDWYMLYRTPEELAELPLRSGFTTAVVHIEPHKIHGIVVAKK